MGVDAFTLKSRNFAPSDSFLHARAGAFRKSLHEGNIPQPGGLVFESQC